MDLYKLESAARVLQEVADKQVHSALLLTVYIHLAKVLVKLFDGFDSVGVRIGHTFDLHAIMLVIGIHGEQALQHALWVALVDLQRVHHLDVLLILHAWLLLLR